MIGDLPRGHRLGNYVILGKLGAGGMADVYKAEDTVLGRHVALKLLPPEFSRDDSLRERFEREVRQVAALNHRNIVTLFEFGDVAPYHFYTMRLLTGGDLRSRIEKGIHPDQAVWILRECAAAFEHAHDHGLVHRDVKPENIVFDENDVPVLTDFGIAKVVNSSTRMTKTGMSVGTPSYISPEQARGREVDRRADLYSLGIIFYEMLTGDVPYKADDSLAVVFKHMTEPVPQLGAKTAIFQPILNALLAKDPDKRMPDARSLIEFLDLFEQDPVGASERLPEFLCRPVVPAPKPPPLPDGDDTVMNQGMIETMVSSGPLPQLPPSPPAAPAAPPPAAPPPPAPAADGAPAIRFQSAPDQPAPAAPRLRPRIQPPPQAPTAAPPPAVSPAPRQPAPAAPVTDADDAATVLDYRGHSAQAGAEMRPQGARATSATIRGPEDPPPSAPPPAPPVAAPAAGRSRIRSEQEQALARSRKSGASARRAAATESAGRRKPRRRKGTPAWVINMIFLLLVLCLVGGLLIVYLRTPS